jgi:ankyrin repeat protein
MLVLTRWARITVGGNCRNYSLNSKELSKGFTNIVRRAQRLIDSTNFYDQPNEIQKKIQGVFLKTFSNMMVDGFSVHHALDNTQLPLHHAIPLSYMIVECLIELGVDVNQCNIFEETPLLHASIYDQVKVAELLIKKNANVLKRSCCKVSKSSEWFSNALPIHAARSAKMIHLLVKHGSPVNNKSSEIFAWTALHFGAMQNNLECIVALLELGAKDTPNLLGQTALDMAKERRKFIKYPDMISRNKRIIELLEMHHKKIIRAC